MWLKKILLKNKFPHKIIQMADVCHFQLSIYIYIYIQFGMRNPNFRSKIANFWSQNGKMRKNEIWKIYFLKNSKTSKNWLYIQFFTRNPNLQSETSENCRKTKILRKPKFRCFFREPLIFLIFRVRFWWNLVYIQSFWRGIRFSGQK